MKRFLALALALATVLSLSGCVCVPVLNRLTETKKDFLPNQVTIPTSAPVSGEDATQPVETEPLKSEAATEVDQMIDELGEITLDSYDQLTKIQLAVDNLTDAELGEVENMADFDAAWETYYTLSYQNAAAQIDDAILAAIASYDADAAINAIHLYNSAPAEVQTYVTLTGELFSTAENIANLLLNNMYKDDDFVRGMTFYYPDAFPMGTDYWYADQRCFALPYMGMQNGAVWLRWVCNYTEDDWVFFDNITFAVDDSRYYKSFDYFDVTRDNEAGAVWEYVDIPVETTELEILTAIANSTTTVIRFEGSDYLYDFTVTDADKAAIRDLLTVYTLLGGN